MTAVVAGARQHDETQGPLIATNIDIQLIKSTQLWLAVELP
jgi:hypothetical protein